MSEQKSDPLSPWSAWPLDREIVITRVVDAPRDLVFEAWADPAQLTAWFGPEGFVIETREVELRAGGHWRFDMIAPDGTRFGNRMTFVRVEPPKLIEVDHGADLDDDPSKFRMLVTFGPSVASSAACRIAAMRPLTPAPQRAKGAPSQTEGANRHGKSRIHRAGRDGLSDGRPPGEEGRP